MISFESTLLSALWYLTCGANAIGLRFLIYKILKSLWFLNIFLWCWEQTHCSLFLGLSEVCEFFFLLKIFSDWDFFSTLHFLFKGPIYCTPCNESLKYVLYNILTCWEKHKFKGCFFSHSGLCTFCYLANWTFNLFSSWLEFKFPIDYYKRKMDQVISIVKFKELINVLYFLIFFCKFIYTTTLTNVLPPANADFFFPIRLLKKEI